MFDGWGEEEVEVMTKMLANGSSSRDVAHALGCSRNAVIGKASRLELPRNRNKGSSQPRAKVSVSGQASIDGVEKAPKYLNRVGIQKARRERDAAGVAPTARPYTPQIASGAPPVPLRLSILDLTDRVCKWPIGDVQSEDFHFCGADRTYGSYCTYHAKIAYKPRERAEQHAIDGMGGRRS
jgi:GcrA cell cycle regulator